jgi:hypothetical protein
VVVVALAGGVLAGWLLRGRGDDPAPSSGLTLIDVQRTEDRGYRFTDWWNDGQVALRLAAVRGGLQLDDPLSGSRAEAPSVSVRLQQRGAVDPEPAAVAALPGGSGTPWVAVGVPYIVNADDPSAVARPVAWAGTARPQGFAPTTDDAPSALPVDTTRQRVNGAEPQVFPALARIGGTVWALVAVEQRDHPLQGASQAIASGLVRCQMRDCRWAAAPRPGGSGGPPVLGLASTGTGFVMVVGVGADPTVWWADDRALTWRQIGRAPKGATLVTTRSEDGEALLLWREGGPDASQVTVQSVRDGQVTTAATGTMAVDRASLTTVSRIGDRWLLGGSRPFGLRASARYEYAAPLLLEHHDGAWRSDDDPLLVNQPDQTIQALVEPAPSAGNDAGPGMLTGSAVLRIDMVWDLNLDDAG